MSTKILAPPSVNSNLGLSQDPYLATARMNADKQMASPALGQDDTMRGRRRTREAENGDGDDLGDAGDSGATAGSSKKRRRSRKGLDKKFECPHEGCGRSYSRAEHLYRHQLNRKFGLVLHSSLKSQFFTALFFPAIKAAGREIFFSICKLSYNHVFI